MKIVWLVCVVEPINQFPNFYVVGVYSVREKAEEQISLLPKEKHYQLFEVPVDEFFGHIDKFGRLLDGMGKLQHVHFLPDEGP